MPPIERSDLRQKAVLWPFAGVDEDGQPTVGVAEQVRCRWEDKRTETKARNGDTIALDALVVVNRVVAPLSNMWLGDIDDVPGTSFLNEDEGLMQVVTAARVPDIKGRSRRYELGLKRFRDTLPG